MTAFHVETPLRERARRIIAAEMATSRRGTNYVDLLMNRIPELRRRTDAIMLITELPELWGIREKGNK